MVTRGAKVHVSMMSDDEQYIVVLVVKKVGRTLFDEQYLNGPYLDGS